MRLFIFLAAISIISFSAGCDNSSTLEDSFSPGVFKLTYIGNTAKRASNESAQLMDHEHLSLGSISNSAFFFFLLSNIGDSDIENIQVTRSNPLFVFSPDSIATLSASLEKNNAIGIRLSLTHGTTPNGVRAAAVLPPGNIETILRLTGDTLDETGDTVEVAYEITLDVDVHVADIEIRSSAGIIDLAKIPITSVSGLAPATIPVYTVADGSLEVTNIGNVDLDIETIKRLSGNRYERLAFSIAPGESFIALRQRASMYIVIDTGGVITDQLKLPILKDNLIWLFFS